MSATQLTGAILNTDIASPTTIPVTVLSTGNATPSNSQTFTINANGAPDCLGQIGGPATPGTSCNDNNACTINDTWSAGCVCVGTNQDTDNDGTCDANDGCPNDPLKIAAGACGCGNQEVGASCNDNNTCTINDVITSCGVCAGTAGPDADNDGTCDANDGCPNDPLKIAAGACGCGVPEVGTSCNDNNSCTVNDVYTSCGVCAGTPPAAIWNLTTTAASTNNLTNSSASALSNGNSFGAVSLPSTGSASTGYVGVSGGNNAGVAATTGTLSTSTSAYFEVTVTPAAGYTFTLGSLSFGTRSTNTGPASYSIRTSQDNFASDVAGGAITVSGNPWALKSHSGLSVSVTGQPLTIRIFGFGGTGSPSSGTANWRIDDLSVGGCTVLCTDTDGDGICDANDNCPNLSGQQGDACNDNNVCTINDVITAGCVCAGTIQDTDGDGVCNANDNCPNVSGQQGSACNDNNVCTTGDVLNASCVCAGTFQDSDTDGTCDANDGCPNDPNKTSPGTCGCGQVDHANGTACDDGSACTVGDTYQNCVCVSGAPLVCNDNDPCTSDVCNPISGCVFTPLPDTDSDGICDAQDNCPNLAGQQGDACNDNNVCTINDVITAGCVCAGTFQDTDSDGICDANDPCPTLANLQNGDPCDDGNAGTINDVVTNCFCAGVQPNDCLGVPGGPAQPGTACNDNSACTINDIYQVNCTCAGTFQDTDSDGICDANDNCPTLSGVQGDVCNDNNVCTINDVITAGCVCAGTFQDTDGDGICDANDNCPNLSGVQGDVCNDNNVCTINDVITAGCVCAGTFQDTDGDGVCDANDNCPTLSGQQGDACNDNNVCTINDVISAGCVCAGTFQDTDGDGICDANDNCPTLSGVQGDACNDNNVCTINDVITAGCVCAGTFQDTDGDGVCDANDNCPTLAGQQGDVCDDDNAGTINDVITAGCICAGVFPNDCLGVPGGTAQPGTACNDNNTCTINDIYQLNCTCAGTFQDTDGDGICDANDNCPSLSGQQGDVCNDNNVCTINDVITAGCVCVGTVQDTDNDGTCDANDGCPNDPLKIAQGQCGCGVADVDSDDDGTADCNDGCMDDPDKTAPGICGCWTPDDDTDGDGLADCIDPCPESTNNADTDGDGTYDCFDNCPTDPNKINPGACGCGVPDVDSDGDGVMNCVDGCPNDPNKIAGGICGCGVADTDSDGDGTANCNDACPNDPNKIAAGVCGCGVPDTDSDGDGVANCIDNCPNVSGQIGSACNDGNANTINDVLNASCQCVGTSGGGCTLNQVTLTLNTDANAAQTTWDIVNSGTTTAVCAGGGYANSSVITVSCCLPNGCYDLRVFDSMGDGINPGGFVLRDVNSNRILDNTNNGSTFTTLSKAATSWCVPMGTSALVASSCDQLNLSINSVIQAQINAAVSAQYGLSSSTSGYQFWIYNPNGGFSRRLFQSHATPGSAYPSGTGVAQRAAYLKLSTMSTGQVIPQFTLLNVRVRTQINGVYGEFGPACLLKIDPSSGCQPTQLTTVGMPTNPAVSCGATVTYPNGTIYANTVAGANKYQFRFVRPGYSRTIAVATRSLQLSVWATLPLSCGLTYDVAVHASFDNGTTYCDYGPICQVTTQCANRPGREVEAAETSQPTLSIWPNPNSTGRINMTLGGLNEGLNRVNLEMYDLLGTRVAAKDIEVEGTDMNYILDLPQGLARGVYMVKVTSANRNWTERLVVE